MLLLCTTGRSPILVLCECFERECSSNDVIFKFQAALVNDLGPMRSHSMSVKGWSTTSTTSWFESEESLGPLTVC